MDVRRAAEWGWSPRTPLRQGLAQTYRYYLDAGGQT
jgi:nucleoside-diphosphate-sugar epimerase